MGFRARISKLSVIMGKQGLYTSFGIVVLLLAATVFLVSQRGGPTTTYSAPRVLEVTATLETDPVTTGGDSADDAALWVNPSDPAQSLVIGTNKKRGVAVYDLSGKEIQFLANLGPLFPKGVFIAQDGSDDKGKQNFKLVPWHSIVDAASPAER